MATLVYNENQLVNCTCNYSNGATITSLSSVTITANEGYVFNTLTSSNSWLGKNSIGIQTNKLSFSESRYVKLSADKKIITVENFTASASSWELSGNVTAVEQSLGSILLTFTGSLTNCVANFSNGQTLTSPTRLTITANDGYIFDRTNYSYYIDYGEEVSFNYSGNVLIYTDITEADFSAITTIEIFDDFIAVQESTDIAVVTISGSLVNCTADFTDGQRLESDTVLTITANDGFEFNSTYWVKVSNGDTQLLTEGKTKLYYPYYKGTGITSIDFFENYTATLKPQETLSDFVRIFNPTDEELSGLSKATFYNLISGSSVPISSYITALYKIPFDVSGLRLADKANIILANYDSQVQSTMLSSWVLETDGGQIIIKPKYNNVFDYINLKCFIYIPYFGKAEIDIERVMSHTLTVTYYTNLYEGMVTVDVDSDFGGTKVFTATKKVGFDIPYVQLSSVSAITEINIPILENELSAFVEIVRDIPITNTETFGKRTVKSVRLNDLSGYQVIDDIEFNALIPDNIQTEIRQLLRNGVFV